MSVKNSQSQPEVLVSIVLPTYCEEQNIGRLIEGIYQSLKIPAEFIVVDDNSADGTIPEVEQTATRVPNVRLIVRTEERGLVSAIKRGIDESRGEIIVWMDCDLSMPPDKVPELIEKVRKDGYSAAIGSRYIPGGGTQYELTNGLLVLTQKCLTRGLNWWTKKMLRTSFNDWTSGFIAIRADVIKKFPFPGHYGEYFIHLMAFLIHHEYRFIEVPYQNVPREYGKSKTVENLFGFIKTGIRYIFVVFRLRFGARK